MNQHDASKKNGKLIWFDLRILGAIQRKDNLDLFISCLFTDKNHF